MPLILRADMPAVDRHLKAIKEDQPKLLMVCGNSDFLYEENVVFQKKLSKLKIDHHHYWSQGGHAWDNWRAYLAETALTMLLNRISPT